MSMILLGMEISKSSDKNSPKLDKPQSRQEKTKEKLTEKSLELKEPVKDFFTKSSDVSEVEAKKAVKSSPPNYRQMIDSDQKMIRQFLKELKEKGGVQAIDLLKAMRNLSRESLNTSPRATVEEVFKHIDAPFPKKIQAIRAYERFLGERQSSLKKQIVQQNKVRIANGETRASVMADEVSNLRPSNKSTVDVGLAIYYSQEEAK